RGHTGERSLEVAFRIDQKVGRDDDAVAGHDSVSNLGVAAAARADLDLTGLKAAFTLIDKDNLTGSAVDYRAVGNGHNLIARTARDFDIGVHVRKQSSIRIGHFNADFG